MRGTPTLASQDERRSTLDPAAKRKPTQRTARSEEPSRRIETALQINPGNVLLFRGLTHSTIAAEKLNGRVRNGNGCVLLAMVTGKLTGYRTLHQNPRPKKALHRGADPLAHFPKEARSG